MDFMRISGSGHWLVCAMVAAACLFAPGAAALLRFDGAAAFPAGRVAAAATGTGQGARPG